MSSESYSAIWNHLKRRLRDDECVPIVSNGLSMKMIWGDEKVIPHWAKAIGYPLPDNHELPHVAQYHRVHHGQEVTTKDEYLEFLKCRLGDQMGSRLAETSPDLWEIAQRDMAERSFSDLAVNVLNFRQQLHEPENPFAILAQLDFPVYLTTSYHTFLEEALRLAGKKPQSGYYNWQGTAQRGKATLDPYIEPTVIEPLVYHLFGRDDRPSSLVLTEDNYFEFFERVLDDFRTDSKSVPYVVRDRLSNSALILLGYDLSNWGFRVLFRGPIKTLFNPSRPQSVSIQLEPLPDSPTTEQIKAYLHSYFGRFNFDVYWGSADSFLQELRRQWSN